MYNFLEDILEEVPSNFAGEDTTLATKSIPIPSRRSALAKRRIGRPIP